jgi:hypothetical protein
LPVNKEGNDGILVCVFGLTSLQNIVYVDSERIKEGVDYMGWYVLGGVTFPFCCRVVVLRKRNGREITQRGSRRASTSQQRKYWQRGGCMY